jgi:hypothetical protein
MYVLYLHSLAVDDLAGGHDGVEEHVGLLAVVHHDALALAADVHGGAHAAEDVHRLLLVVDGHLRYDGTVWQRRIEKER